MSVLLKTLYYTAIQLIFIFLFFCVRFPTFINIPLSLNMTVLHSTSTSDPTVPPVSNCVENFKQTCQELERIKASFTAQSQHIVNYVLPAKISSLSEMLKEFKASTISSVEWFPCGAAPNQSLLPMFNRVKSEILEFASLLDPLRTWLAFLQPKMSDNVSRSVQLKGELIETLSNTRSQCTSLSEHCMKYHITRAKLITKSMKFPLVTDYRTAVQRFDERQHTLLVEAVTSVRDSCAHLYDLFQKNLKTITKTTQDDQNIMILY